jgi:hypothetical protein
VGAVGVGSILRMNYNRHMRDREIVLDDFHRMKF